jgi:hypothetical protein
MKNIVVALVKYFTFREVTKHLHMQLIKTGIITAVLFLYACNPCSNSYLGCSEDNYNSSFRIVSKIDGRDLVFRQARVYDRNNIKLYTLKGSDTTFLNFGAVYMPGIGYDSVLSVRFFPVADVAYMRLSNGDIDTFNIKYRTQKDKCCDAVTTIDKLQFNSVELDFTNYGENTLKK